MKEKHVQLETSYKATSPLLSDPFEGEVIAKFINTVALQITDYSERDNERIGELNYRVIVRYVDLSVIGS